MAQGEFTKQEADATIEAVNDIFDGMSRNKKAEYAGHYNDIVLFIQAAKLHAPDEKDLTDAGKTVSA